MVNGFIKGASHVGACAKNRFHQNLEIITRGKLNRLSRTTLFNWYLDLCLIDGHDGGCIRKEIGFGVDYDFLIWVNLK